MKTRFYLTLLIALFVAMYTMQGQETEDKHCSFEQTTKEYFDQNPEELQKAIQQEINIKQFIDQKKNGRLKTAGKYIIPVVFHVFGTDWKNDKGNLTTPEVTNEIIKSSLQDVNDNFKGFNDDVDPFFRNIEGGMDVEFRLAQIDPNGNTTSGIMYYESRSGFALNGTKDDEIVKYAWDNFKYMNVYIQVQIKGSSRNKSGTAWLPSISMTEKGTARVVYNGRYITYIPPASSLTHEFGHYLNLEHTFNGGCIAGGNNGDKVADTPPTKAGTAANSDDDGCLTNITNCFNERINYQNHMDYNPCESMFTKGQVNRMEAALQHPARITLWQNDNLRETGVDRNLGARILFTYQERLDDDTYKSLGFTEDFGNDGTVNAKKKIKAIDGARFAKTGKLKAGTDFTTNQLPNGLEVSLEVLDAFTAEIKVSGKASAHEAINSGSFNLQLLNPAIVGGTSAVFSNSGKYAINFLDSFVNQYEHFAPFLIAQHGLTDNTGSRTTKFASTAIGGNLTVAISVQDGNKLVVDNLVGDYEVACNNGSNNVAYFNNNQRINDGSAAWKKSPGPSNYLPVLIGGNYQAWKGKTGYVGIRKATLNGTYIYGWLKVSVDATGQKAFCDMIGLNPEPGASMETGIKSAYLSYSSDRFVESDANDNTIKNSITVSINGDQFAKIGKLVAGTDYAISEVPSGTTAEIIVTNSNTATIALGGKMNRATGGTAGWNVYRGNFKINFLDNAFASNNVNAVKFSEFKPKVEYVGESFTQKLDEEPVNIDVEDFGNSFFFLNSAHTIDGDKYSYAIQYYEPLNGVRQTPGTKLITYRKDAVANENYEVIPLDKGALISANSPWKNGREFYTGTGQQLIDGDNYKAWRGKTKYIGIRGRKSGEFHYGWIELKVSSNGKVLQFLSFGINGTPNQGIRAGTLDSVDVDPTCTDGIQNGDETGIDCGGSCKPCSTDINAGTVATTDNQTSVTTITGDGQADIINFTKSGNSDDAYRYLITDDAGKILAIETDSHDFEGASLGICRVYGIAYKGSLSVSNKNIADSGLASGQYDISNNWIVVDRVAPSSCTDGIQNGDETGIDCGGSCKPCSIDVGDYCDAGVQGNNYIKEVNFGTINNPSDNRPYSDHTAISTTVEKGKSYPLNVRLGIEASNWTKNNIGAWIDWNQDGDFNDNGEFVFQKTSSPGGGSGTVTVPANAKKGATRMRLRFNYHTMPKPCGTDRRDGDEAEDYTVIVSDKEVVSEGEVIYVDIKDQTASRNAPWDFFRIEVGDDNKYGAWYSRGTIYLETYQKEVVTQGASRNIQWIGENQLIGPDSNFTPNSRQYVVSSNTYSSWNGRSGYIGFNFQIEGNTHYGWFYVTVANDGKSYTVLDYAYNTAPGAGLKTTRNGKSTVNNLTDAGDILIYPNPFTTSATLDISSLQPNDVVTLSILDVSGKKIVERVLTTNKGLEKIGASLTTKGVYFVRVKSNNFIETYKIIKK